MTRVHCGDNPTRCSVDFKALLVEVSTSDLRQLIPRSARIWLGACLHRLPAQPLAQPLDLALECVITTTQLRRALIRAARCRGVTCRLTRPRTVRSAVAPVSRRYAALGREPIRTGGVRIAPEDGLIERESRGRQEQQGDDRAHRFSTGAAPDGCPSHT